MVIAAGAAEAAKNRKRPKETQKNTCVGYVSIK